MRKVVYSDIAREKLKNLYFSLCDEYGKKVADKHMKTIFAKISNLGAFPEMGIDISELYTLETDYRYLFIDHNYFVYRIESDSIVVVQIYNEREDFMMKLFGISGRSDESIEYWGD